VILTLATSAALQLADVLTTALVLQRGAGFESNLVGASMLAHGLIVAIFVKAVLVPLAFALYLVQRPARRRLRLGVVQGVSVAMAFVVLSNAGLAAR
jgi:hypothetical protein